ncbi:MAG TPA: cation-translocating P-type ATPase [Tepidisphaeraceae bacterium]|jgi:Ca2+-transporting ATPase|nr:cation-translocating P-type ATPase [Tepidisphaeraceae bacterium]
MQTTPADDVAVDSEPSARLPHVTAAAELIVALGSDAHSGLAAAQLEALRVRHGANRLAEAPPPSRWGRFLRQFNELIIWILILAALVSGFMQEWTDAIAILAIVLLNGVLGFLQEERAGKALAALRQMSSPQAKVVRDGVVRMLPAEDLLPGDRVELEAGDFIPADLRLVSASGLRVQEAALTGESAPVDKDPAAVLESDTPLAERITMAYMGTLATSGKAAAIVVAIGMRTELGKIAGLLQHEDSEPTPLQRRLAELGKVIVAACLVIVAIIFVLQVLRGSPIHEAFLLAVSLAVAAVPEGLPAVVTIALALGLQRMAKRNALVRKLPSVETLGSVTVICSDKTGTLTRNEMTVREVYAGGGRYEVSGVGYSPEGNFRKTANASEGGNVVRGTGGPPVSDALPLNEPHGTPTDSTEHGRAARATAAQPILQETAPSLDPDLIRALTIGAWCNYAHLAPPAPGEGKSWRLTGDPTEGALMVAALKAGIVTANREHELLYELPFDSDRKLMTVVARGAGGHGIAYTKGAPEVVLARCNFERHGGAVVPLSAARRSEILAASSDMAARALRVLGLAYRDMPGVWPQECLECELVFSGLAGLFDPPREEARPAVDKCHRAGIRPVMITGDHPATALAVARDLGIARDSDSALTGKRLDELDDAALANLVEQTPVYARVTAEHKLRVVRAWQARGHVVAMTGDGVNDAPAVKSADIGIAMGKAGTDVTREAADMVLTDDNFASIVAAVEEGRGIFDDIQKFVHYLLSCNTGEVLVMFVGALAGWPAPLVAIQILWVNLVTDALPALALGIERPEPDIMERRPRPPREGVITLRRGLLMLFHGTLIAAMTITGFVIVRRLNPDSLDAARTVAFCILSYSQLFYSFACRSQRYTLPELGALTNPHLLGAIAISGLIQLAVFLPFLRGVFHVTWLTWEWPLVLLLALTPVTIIEVLKILRSAMKRMRALKSSL